MRLSGLSLAARLVVVAAGSCSSFSLAQEARQYRENGIDLVTKGGGSNGTLVTTTELDGIDHSQIAQYIKKIKSGA